MPTLGRAPSPHSSLAPNIAEKKQNPPSPLHISPGSGPALDSMSWVGALASLPGPMERKG